MVTMTVLPPGFRDMHPSPIGLGCMFRHRVGELSLRRLASSRLTLMANFGIKARKVTKRDLRPHCQNPVVLHAFGCMERQAHKASFHEHFFAEAQGLIVDDVVRCGSLALQSVHVGALSLHRLHVRPLLHGSRMTCHLCKLSATLGLHRLHVTHLLRRSGVTCNWCKAFGCMDMHPQACKASFHEGFFAAAQGLHCR